MQPSTETAEEILRTAVEVVTLGADNFFTALDGLPAAIYVTDAEGLITYFNAACIDFAGRTPVVGQDRWCVTWKLYTEAGAYLPHDECPTAIAIQTKRPIRGVTAMAERPDGTGVTFLPYPTPIFDKDGALVGAVNILIDLTDSRQADFLRAQAVKCRRLANSMQDQQTADTLNLMAAEYDDKALMLESRN
jgi:PAS domain-containing protein